MNVVTNKDSLLSVTMSRISAVMPIFTRPESTDSMPASLNASAAQVLHTEPEHTKGVDASGE